MDSVVSGRNDDSLAEGDLEDSLAADLDIDPHTWNVEQLAQWISDQAFKEEISDIIKEQRIDGECLYELASNSSLLRWG
jgi:hypothetical protein